MSYSWFSSLLWGKFRGNVLHYCIIAFTYFCSIHCWLIIRRSATDNGTVYTIPQNFIIGTASTIIGAGIT